METLCASPKVLKILKQGYILPFWTGPNLTWSPTIISCYRNPHRNLYLLEALHQPMNQNAVELVQRHWFKALPFGLSTAPIEFTEIVKEAKLMALHRGIMIHQYLDNWLVRGRSHQVCLQHTRELVEICRKLGWLVNLKKSELDPKQVFDFVGYQFDLKCGRVRPTLDQRQTLQEKVLELLSRLACPVRQFLIGLLTATEKQVHLGRLHMRSIQRHKKQQLKGTRITGKGRLFKRKYWNFSPDWPVRSGLSLIGLLTATEKQVHLGRLHMRSIQRHQKNN